VLLGRLKNSAEEAVIHRRLGWASPGPTSQHSVTQLSVDGHGAGPGPRRPITLGPRANRDNVIEMKPQRQGTGLHPNPAPLRRFRGRAGAGRWTSTGPPPRAAKKKLDASPPLPDTKPKKPKRGRRRPRRGNRGSGGRSKNATTGFGDGASARRATGSETVQIAGLPGRGV